MSDKDESKYKCPACDQCFDYHELLISHIQLHCNKDLLLCHICNMILVDNTSLNRHMSTHQKELLFNCQFCEKKFSSYKSRWYHLKKDHKQDHHSRSHLKLKSKYNILESTNIAKILLKVVNNN